jgi:hypothetical protein
MSYGSHADIESFRNRLEVRMSSDQEKGHFMVHYFEISDPTEAQKIYFQTLRIFYSMFKIFKLIFDKRLRVIDTDWEYTIKGFENKLAESINRYKV